LLNIILINHILFYVYDIFQKKKFNFTKKHINVKNKLNK